MGVLCETALPYFKNNKPMNPICEFPLLFLALAFFAGANFGKIVFYYKERKIWKNYNEIVKAKDEHIKDLMFDIEVRAKNKEKAAWIYPMHLN